MEAQFNGPAPKQSRQIKRKQESPEREYHIRYAIELFDKLVEEEEREFSIVGKDVMRIGFITGWIKSFDYFFEETKHEN